MIRVEGLSKTFGSLEAVRDLHLSVPEGQIYGLVGPDGAGKTTTLRLLCGALRPDPAGKSGTRIEIGGYDLLSELENARAQIGYLPQRFSLYEELTVLENIGFFAEMRGIPAAEWRPRCMAILEFVGLVEFTNRRAGQLSGGMKQKLGLAAALVHRPKVLLLDEPTTGVDPVTRQDFWQLIIQMVAESRQNGGSASVLVTTPYMDEAARCQKVGFMRLGKLLVEGSPQELRQQLEGRILELTGEPLEGLRRIAGQIAGVESVQRFGERLHLRIQAGQQEAVSEELSTRVPAEGGVLYSLDRAAPQLEDVFMSLAESEDE